jgi:dipeptidyl aminopeptidase/acylaminoacyl peptidase
LYQLQLDEDGPAGKLELLVDPNAAWSEEVLLFQPKTFSVSVANRTVHGWYFLPEPDGEIPASHQPCPTVLSIHGGPEWMYGGYFLPEFHILPESGYAVLIANPTGSTGYGMEFQSAIRGDWVGKPAADLLACLDWAEAAGWADPNRWGVMGGSYGGHLTAALTTQTDRFRAAAVDRMTCDLVSFWATTDEKWFPEWEFLGRPFDPASREIYLQNSPASFLDRVVTPTLISHGMRDYRCLISQSETWFAGLAAREVPVRFLRFQQEAHGIRNRENLVYYWGELLTWFERYLRPLPQPQPQPQPQSQPR